jgi:DNA-binding MarR family transcriptional regulator
VFTRRPSATDRRVNTIELQPAAGAALDGALAVSDQVQHAALAGFTAAERQQLTSLLQRVRANLSGHAAPASSDPDRPAREHPAHRAPATSR